MSDHPVDDFFARAIASVRRKEARARLETHLTGIPRRFSYCLHETSVLTGSPVPMLRKAILGFVLVVGLAIWIWHAKSLTWLAGILFVVLALAGIVALIPAISEATMPDRRASCMNKMHQSALAFPTENEWYKAAYCKGGGTNAGYWLYPTQSDARPINTLPDSGNHGNFYDWFLTGNHDYTDPTNYLTPVGAFAESPGPYGTFDQGGDVWQWNETEVSSSTRGQTKRNRSFI